MKRYECIVCGWIYDHALSTCMGRGTMRSREHRAAHHHHPPSKKTFVPYVSFHWSPILDGLQTCRFSLDDACLWCVGPSNNTPPGTISTQSVGTISHQMETRHCGRARATRPHEIGRDTPHSIVLEDVLVQTSTARPRSHALGRMRKNCTKVFLLPHVAIHDESMDGCLASSSAVLRHGGAGTRPKKNVSGMVEQRSARCLGGGQANRTNAL